ncbi:MAG: RNA 2',3'-cyclic phosphodiesterase [Terriglobia bacterium]
MRLFVALDLPPAVREVLRDLIARLQRSSADVRWMRAEGIHLTLKFIGETPPEQLGRVQEALRAVRSPQAVELEFRGLGFFPHERRPRVFWMGVRASDNLFELAGQVEAALEPLGIAREQRSYTPHLTLGRFKSPARLARLQDEIAHLNDTEFGRARTREFALYQSKLLPGGAHYTQLERFAFAPD